MATFDTWGGSWGSSWGLSWTRTVGTIGGGGGGPLDMGEESPPLKPILFIDEPEDRFKERRERNARVREQLRIALEGPQAEELRTVLEPKPADSARPLYERIDVERFDAELMELVERHYRAALEAQAQAQRQQAEARALEIAEDDEDVQMLVAIPGMQEIVTAYERISFAPRMRPEPVAKIVPVEEPIAEKNVLKEAMEALNVAREEHREMNGKLVAQVLEMVDAIDQPKRVVRDSDGNIVGLELK